MRECNSGYTSLTLSRTAGPQVPRAGFFSRVRVFVLGIFSDMTRAKFCCLASCMCVAHVQLTHERIIS